jgi:hypothetical protein
MSAFADGRQCVSWGIKHDLEGSSQAYYRDDHVRAVGQPLRLAPLEESEATTGPGRVEAVSVSIRSP